MAQGWDTNVAAALDAIAGRLGRRGQWPGRVVIQNRPADSRRDIAAPLTALGMLCLPAVPGSAGLLARSRQHIEATVLPGGVWRYYANIPWDCDDTAMCALALGDSNPTLADTRTSLTAAVTEDGRFYTWPDYPRQGQALDAVANAHVVAVLGPDGPVGGAVRWLDDVVARGAEVASCCYYPDPLDTHMAIGRAVEAGVEALLPALRTAGDRARQRLRGPLPDYRLAQAIVVARLAGIPAADLLEPGARLAAVQGADGFWQPEALYTAVVTKDYGGLALYTSTAVTTALCARALAMLGDG